jgi:hypothetical protein
MTVQLKAGARANVDKFTNALSILKGVPTFPGNRKHSFFFDDKDEKKVRDLLERRGLTEAFEVRGN